MKYLFFDFLTEAPISVLPMGHFLSLPNLRGNVVAVAAAVAAAAVGDDDDDAAVVVISKPKIDKEHQ